MDDDIDRLHQPWHVAAMPEKMDAFPELKPVRLLPQTQRVVLLSERRIPNDDAFADSGVLGKRLQNDVLSFPRRKSAEYAYQWSLGQSEFPLRNSSVVLSTRTRSTPLGRFERGRAGRRRR